MPRNPDVLMRQFSPPVRTGTSWTGDKRRDVTQTTKIVDLVKKGSADSESLTVRNMTGYDSEHAAEALGKPRGFDRRDVGARMPQINILYLL